MEERETRRETLRQLAPSNSAVFELSLNEGRRSISLGRRQRQMRGAVGYVAACLVSSDQRLTISSHPAE